MNIRIGIKEDVPALLELVRELAIFEKEPDAVVVSVDELEKDGFGSNPLYGFFVAEIDNEIVGISHYYYRYSTWKGKCLYLEDLIVTEKHRGKGIGKALFQRTIDKAKADKCRKMNWQVLDWNTPAIDFYKDFDAGLDGEWINGYLDL
jgi:GNAT superfamily N-acetyltransferase